MKRSHISRHVLASVVLLLPLMAKGVAYAQASQSQAMPEHGATSTTGVTITHVEPPHTSGYWTPERMRAAKPFPMPTRKGPPVMDQKPPSPYTEPPHSSSPGLGGPPH